MPTSPAIASTSSIPSSRLLARPKPVCFAAPQGTARSGDAVRRASWRNLAMKKNLSVVFSRHLSPAQYVDVRTCAPFVSYDMLTIRRRNLPMNIFFPWRSRNRLCRVEYVVAQRVCLMICYQAGANVCISIKPGGAGHVEYRQSDLNQQ